MGVQEQYANAQVSHYFKMTQLFFLSLTASLSLTVAHGQTEQLNKFDSTGKKVGKWIVYLDGKWKKVKDSTEAIYCRYTWFDHGVDIVQAGFINKHLKLYPADSNIQKGKPKLLDGEYHWIDKRARPIRILVLKQGEFISIKGFYKSGNLQEFVDFTKKWKGQPHTYRWYLYDKKGKVNIDYQRWNDDYDSWSAWGGYYGDSTSVDTLRIVGDSAYVITKYYKDGELRRKADEILVHISNLRTKTIKHGITVWSYGRLKREEQYNYGKKIGETKDWYEK